MERDISKGLDPIEGLYNIYLDHYSFRVNDKTYTFAELPFALAGPFADKALILKHADKAIISG